MCLILLGWRAHPRYPLIFAGNRDEAYDRPTAAPAFWSDFPAVYGGRDLEKNGTWLGLTQSGRIAAVTNYRERPALRNAARSRGELTAGYLRAPMDARRYLEQVMRSGTDYAAFSLMVGDGDQLLYCSNRANGIQELPPGVHGLSNHLLNTPWPKVTRGKQQLAQLLAANEAALTAGLFDILLDRTPALESGLPETGVGLQRERELSPSFIAGEHYGTRASTVVLVDREGLALFVERAFGPRGAALATTENRFHLENLTSPERAP